MQFFPGRLLAANVTLADPRFYRAVIYVLDHDGSGALGLICNQRTHTPLSLHLPEIAERAAEPPDFFVGGPVAQDFVSLAAAIEGAVQLVDLDDLREGLDVSRLRAFSGYSGWGAGQLEAELAEGSWYVVDSQPNDLFDNDPDTLWRRVMARQAGELATLALYPDDVTSN